MERGEVAGVVALAADRERVLYEGAFGVRALGQTQGMTLDTVFRIASMTKLVTVIAALQLVERGRLALDEPVGDRLAHLGAAVQVLDGFQPDGSQRLRAPRQPITLKHLLTHTSGHAYATWNSAVCQLKQAAAVSSSTFTTFDAPLVCDPGDRWEYGAGIDWTGRLIEHISGESLEDYFRAHIFDPLGMDETSFILRDDQRTRVAGRHARQADGSLLLNDVPIPPRPVIFNGGGGLYSTGPDYLRLLRMLLGDGTYESNTVLRPESVAELARNHIAELTVERLPTAEPDMSNDMEFFPGMVKKWSLGGLLTTEPTCAGRGAGSWAWGGLFNTYFWVDPGRGVAGLLLTQILPFCDSAVLALLDRFEADVYAPSDA